ncbi:hypothetical protein HK102_006774 [Quaeritorhiza haematococci]|nr:hypothetical protein HK102_006774 [Quaeritorhiza haematococci]
MLKLEKFAWWRSVGGVEGDEAVEIKNSVTNISVEKRLLAITQSPLTMNAPDFRHSQLWGSLKLVWLTAALTASFMVFPCHSIDWLSGNLSQYLPNSSPPPVTHNISYNRHALLIDNQPQLLLAGAIHYPRSTPNMWPSLFRRSAEAGLNTIQLYTFWDIHEPEEGVFDFESGNANLPLFLDLAQKAGMFVVLRIGPYVCAEWNWGGFPTWLLTKPGMEVRTMNAPFMEAMERFVRKTVDVVRPYLASNGGPIILLQIENEYGHVQRDYGPDGMKYALWAADLANSLNTGVPWIMCVQDNVPTVINTCNGFYCDNWIEQHWRMFENQPAFFTENWPGWFQAWGDAKPTRPAQDVAFSVARWFARGGSYVAYYMWHGGTNFGRTSGARITTSYDYDAPLDEYGFPNEPKYSHLSQLHHILLEYADVLTSTDPQYRRFGRETEGHTYWDSAQPNQRALVFLSNWNDRADSTVRFDGAEYKLPRWSVTLLVRNTGTPSLEEEAAPRWRVVYRTSDIDGTHGREKRTHPSRTDLKAPIPNPLDKHVSWVSEPIGLWNASSIISARRPLEHIRTTLFHTDYLWYVKDVNVPSVVKEAVGTENAKIDVTIENLQGVAYIFVNGRKVDFTTKNEPPTPESPPPPVSSLDMQHEPDFDLSPPLEMHRSASRTTIQATFPSTLIAVEGLHVRIQTGSSDSPDQVASNNLAFRLQVLVTVNGMENFGAHLERVQKGILGRVLVNGVDITGPVSLTEDESEASSSQGLWLHQIGLQGEKLQYHKPQVNLPWTPGVPVNPSNTPLTWYRIIFKRVDLRSLQKTAFASLDNSPGHMSFVLFLGSMGRGHAWVNGNAIGRYWDIRASSTGCVDNNGGDVDANGQCRWEGGFYPDKCRIGCGKPTQEFYHVPVDWVFVSDDGDGDVEVALLEERGGDPAGVYFAAVAG